MYRPLDLVAVKGKKQAERIFKIFNSDPKDIQDKKQQMMHDYNQALEFYYATKWDESLRLFEKCLKVYPEDIVCQTYVERCKDFKITPPSQNWDGVFRMTKK